MYDAWQCALFYPIAAISDAIIVSVLVMTVTTHDYPECLRIQNGKNNSEPNPSVKLANFSLPLCSC